MDLPLLKATPFGSGSSRQTLELAIKKSGFFGSLVVSLEGLIIRTSDQMDPNIEVESLAAKAAALFKEDWAILKKPEEIIISYPGRKISIRKLSDHIHVPILHITIMPDNFRYFKRKVKNVANIFFNILSG